MQIKKMHAPKAKDFQASSHNQTQFMELTK